MAAAGRPASGQRVDARRNRAALVVAARAVFAERGIDASVEAILERAGVGTGTLYRHFPSREALVDAIFEEKAEEIIGVVERALACPDALLGLEQLIEQTVELQRRDHVLRELMMRYQPRPGFFDETHSRIEELSEQLLDRARREGVLRADFTLADLIVLFWSLGPVLDATADVAPEAWRRHLRFVLDGLSPQAATTTTVPPLAPEQRIEAMRRLREQRFQHWKRAGQRH